MKKIIQWYIIMFAYILSGWCIGGGICWHLEKPWLTIIGLSIGLPLFIASTIYSLYIFLKDKKGTPWNKAFLSWLTISPIVIHVWSYIQFHYVRPDWGVPKIMISMGNASLLIIWIISTVLFIQDIQTNIYKRK